jgi:hypothetical protein
MYVNTVIAAAPDISHIPGTELIGNLAWTGVCVLS